MLLNPVPSKQYGKDFKKIVKSPKFNQIEYLVVLTKLLIGEPLPIKYGSHPLKGEYDGYSDCHITNDCVLIFKIAGNELRLARIGTHSEVFKK